MRISGGNAISSDMSWKGAVLDQTVPFHGEGGESDTKPGQTCIYPNKKQQERVQHCPRAERPKNIYIFVEL